MGIWDSYNLTYSASRYGLPASGMQTDLELNSFYRSYVLDDNFYKFKFNNLNSADYKPLFNFSLNSTNYDTFSYSSGYSYSSNNSDIYNFKECSFLKPYNFLNNTGSMNSYSLNSYSFGDYSWSKTNSFNSYSGYYSSTGYSINSFGAITSGNRAGTISKRASTGSLQLDLAQNAFAYVGKVNSDREGNRLFSNGSRQAWCADFVTYVTKDTFGNRLPSDFGSSSVSGLRDWASRNDCYFNVPTSNRKSFIKENVHVGDIMIEKRNGKSHTGIVKEVADDGSWFKVVEGNSSNKVQTVTYAANSSTLSGFISLDKYCA